MFLALGVGFRISSFLVSGLSLGSWGGRFTYEPLLKQRLPFVSMCEVEATVVKGVGVGSFRVGVGSFRAYLV